MVFVILEVILEDTSPYLIEVNPRLPGGIGYFSDVYYICYGSHHLKIFEQLILESEIPLQKTYSDNYAMIFLLNNLLFSYKRIIIDKINKLSSFVKMDIINKERIAMC